MKEMIKDNKYIEEQMSDEDFLKVLSETKTKTAVVCFENEFTEGRLFERLAEKDFINNVFVYGIKCKDKTNKKINYIKRIKKNELKDIQCIVFYIKTDVDVEVVKPLVTIKDLCDEMSIDFGVKTENGLFLGNSNEKSSLLIETLTAALTDSLRERYEMVYDYLCDELDKKFADNSLCKFANDRCALNRKCYNHDKIMGCCYSFKYNGLYFSEIKRCVNLGEKGCKVKCIGCKLFTCKYLRKQGYRFRLKNMALAEAFFTRKQQDIMRTTFFVEKKVVIDEVLKG